MRERRQLRRRGRTEGVTPSEPGQTGSETQVSCDLTHLWNLKTRKAKNPNSEKEVRRPWLPEGGGGRGGRDGRWEALGGGGQLPATCGTAGGGGAESPRHENFLFLCSFFFLFSPASLTDG